jgi:predicted NBD/HSP70 family sugar kinase
MALDGAIEKREWEVMRERRDIRRAVGRGATQDAVRQHNLAALLGHIHRCGPTSRAQLTKLLSLNRSTIGALVDDLAARGLVAEGTAQERGSPGRPSNVVRVRTDTIAAVAVVLGVDTVTVAVVTPGGHILERSQVGLDSERDRSFERVLGTVGRAVKDVVGRLPASTQTVGIGVAVPGVVRAEDGLVHFAPNLAWREVPLGARLASRIRSQIGLSIPVLCRNDAKLGAVAEHTRGVGSGVANLVYVHAEVGVGGGIIADNKLLEGTSGYAGEIGHMRVNPEGTPCRCGSRGCWETEVGEDTLVVLAGRRPGGRAAVDEVLTAAAGGEQAAGRALEAVARWVGIGLANIVNCFNPDMVVLGGFFADVLEIAGQTVTAQLRAGLVTQAQLEVQLVAPGLGRDAVLIGAAEVALEPVLGDPGCIPVQVEPQPRAPPLRSRLTAEGA